jgi:fructokinase
MSPKKELPLSSSKPLCVGTGLIALDVFINETLSSLPLHWAGGSCGNVLTILCYLGWDSYPIAILQNNGATKQLLEDLEMWQVNTCLIYKTDLGSTPVIVQKLSTRKSGAPWHRFEWNCPSCGAGLPRHKPFPTKNLEEISSKVPEAQVFYFDRVSRSSIELARLNKARGSLVMFEPSGIKDENLFLECLKLAHIVKYSHDRLGHAKELTQKVKIPLEVETLGPEGLRYRLGNSSKKSKTWKLMPAYTVKSLKDTAGAGDWCSAGIIHMIGNDGEEGFESIREIDIENALGYGQALAALNCYYEGARGSMYKLSKTQFEKVSGEIWNGFSPTESAQELDIDRHLRTYRLICQNCIE